jgi:hypothetical protein
MPNTPLSQSITSLLWYAGCTAAWLLLPAAIGGAGAADREHGAHTHGVSQLNLAVEGKDVEIELVSPASDIVGFEHAPETAPDKAAVTKATDLLGKGAAVFLFPADARCSLKEAAVRSTLEAAREPQRDDRAHGKKEDHGRETHAEFHVRYHFQCENPAALTHVDVKLFAHFAAMRELEVQALTGKGQSAQELTSESPRLKL